MKPYLGDVIGRTTPCALALCLLLTGCAQTGAPLPPSLELPKPPTDLRASRKGNRVTLNWSEPVVTTDRRSIRYLGPTLVCRSREAEITVCGNPDALVPPPSLAPRKSSATNSLPQTYTDVLPALMQPEIPTAEVTYAVEVLNRNARGAGLSNRVHVPAVPTLPTPSDFAARLTADGVVITWMPAAEPQVVPGIQHRYRIYRRQEGSGKDAIAGEVALGDSSFTDTSFEWEMMYQYRICVVTMIKRNDTDVQVEGDDSSPVRVVAHDVFPPAVPVGLQTAFSGEGQKPFVDLIWAPVTSADLAGYNVYRTEAGDTSKGDPAKLNSELVKSPSYRDSAVSPGKIYSYSVSAVDVRGNESPRSEAASESVP